MNTNNSQAPQLPQTDVKCRFFAQYYGQEILRWHQWIETTPDSKVDLSIPAIEKSGWFIKLKPLSKITKEHLQQIFIKEFPFDTIFNSYDFMCKYDLRNYFIISNVCEKKYLKIIDFENNKEFNYSNYKTISHIGIDFLRSQGYAVPFMEYSVDDLISFGWVRLS